MTTPDIIGHDGPRLDGFVIESDPTRTSNYDVIIDPVVARPQGEKIIVPLAVESCKVHLHAIIYMYIHTVLCYKCTVYAACCCVLVISYVGLPWMEEECNIA